MILINHVATDNEKKAGAVVTQPRPISNEEAPATQSKPTQAKAEKKSKTAKKTEE